MSYISVVLIDLFCVYNELTRSLFFLSLFLAFFPTIYFEPLRKKCIRDNVSRGSEVLVGLRGLKLASLSSVDRTQ